MTVADGRLKLSIEWFTESDARAIREMAEGFKQAALGLDAVASVMERHARLEPALTEPDGGDDACHGER